MSENCKEQQNYKVIKFDHLEQDKKEFSNRALFQFHDNKRRKKQFEFPNGNDNSVHSEENKTTSSIKNEKDFYTFYINNNERNKEEFNFKNNKIDTTKDNIITFLPKGLLYQFMRLANVYFLFTAILQCIPVISPLGSATALFPIILCTTITQNCVIAFGWLMLLMYLCTHKDRSHFCEGL